MDKLEQGRGLKSKKKLPSEKWQQYLYDARRIYYYVCMRARNT